jgi:hypothetical protein
MRCETSAALLVLLDGKRPAHSRDKSPQPKIQAGHKDMAASPLAAHETCWTPCGKKPAVGNPKTHDIYFVNLEAITHESPAYPTPSRRTP